MPRMAVTRTAVIAIAVLAPSIARADVIVSGEVIKVDHQEIYVNLGRGKGVDDGVEVRLKHPIALHHPTTRARVDDWIPLGAATITEAGDQMSRAVLGALVGEIHVGDVAEVYVDEAAPVPPAPTPAPAPEPDAPKVDPATRQVLAVFAAQSGAPLDARIAAWEAYQSANPDSPYLTAIEADLGQLRELRDTITPAGAVRDVARVDLDHVAPTHAAPGADVPVVFVLDRPEAVATGWLHYRKVGARTYHRLLLHREHGIYLRGAVPAQGGPLEYFVEVTTSDGTGGVAAGSPERPNRVEIDRETIADRFEPERGRTELTLSTVYLDFANLDRRHGDRTDREVFAEADVRYHMRGLIRSIGAGYGVFSGVGGADAVWSPASPPPKTGFNYGYAEVEVGGGTRLPIAIAGRLLAGVGKTGFEVGVEARGRLGADDGTNLTASVRNLAEIGFLSELRLETWPGPRLPIGVAVGVLDQPSGDDLAVRLGVDAGYTIGPVSPTLRVSWQGRSIDHGGIGGGLSLAFRW